MLRILAVVILSTCFTALPQSDLCASYHPVGHAPLPPGALAVDSPGYCDEPGRLYMLTGDIRSARTALFLARDVTLDLNGYTVSYADTSWGHVPNFGFERGLEGWDLSRAPGAALEKTREVHVFIGEHILRLAKGDEIVSGWVDLPVPGRSYLAMCGVLTWEMKVSLFVEDENGGSVRVLTRYGDSTLVSCPVEQRSPRLGGGFVTAHLQGLPVGKYRVRVRADTDCLVDHVDIRPAMDAGVAIVGRTSPLGHNDHLYRGQHPAFFDYTVPGTADPLEGIPRAEGAGTVTIRNGVIESGALGVLSWGVQSTAPGVKVILDNVRIIASGINTNAVDVPAAVIDGCRFDIDTPFIINRHVSEHAVVLRGTGSSVVSHSEFYGGQGCLTFHGVQSEIHHNLFVNRQTVTNHYCVMARGDSSRVFANRFEPEIGSGLEIFRHKYIDVFDNYFLTEAAPPSCEYGHEEYSTTAIRIADYNAEPGSPRGAYGNRIYNNEMIITGRDYPEYPDYIPMAWAFFYSASGGQNHVFGNRIIVNHRDPGSKAEASAFYIGGGTIGGVFSGNRIVSNVPVAWIGNPYGAAEGSVLSENTVVRAHDAPRDMEPFRMGFGNVERCVAKNIEFRSNRFEGLDFGISSNDMPHSYTVFWTLEVRVARADGEAAANVEVSVLDCGGELAAQGRTGDDGLYRVELPQLDHDGGSETTFSPYTVRAGGRKQKVDLSSNRTVQLTLR